jgi:hypothetical protein
MFSFSLDRISSHEFVVLFSFECLFVSCCVFKMACNVATFVRRKAPYATLNWARSSRKAVASTVSMTEIDDKTKVESSDIHTRKVRFN